MRCLCLLTFLIGVVVTYTTPALSRQISRLQSNRTSGNNTASAAVCRDKDLAKFISTSMTRYIHDMGGLSKDILDQITAYRKPGTWIVHAEIISGRVQGRDWQTMTNGDVFSGKSLYGCFFHDMQTYILVLRLY
ncbi:hypothetical protein RB195_017782 [Necator americanus]|uniref:Uncharacterized protein n=1 Tax=Necator americanus TaxID=51031 RepID=A0ABR1C9P4_NECAM